MVLRIWGFWIESVEIALLRQEIGFWPLNGYSFILTVERCIWVFRISTDRDLKRHKMRRALGSGQRSKNYVSILVSPLTEVKKLKNPFVSETTESACIWICIVLRLWLTSLNYTRIECFIVEYPLLNFEGQKTLIPDIPLSFFRRESFW